MTLTITPAADGRRVEIRFPYDRDIMTTVSCIPGARWDRRSGCWVVHSRHVEALERIAALGRSALGAWAEAAAAHREALREPCAGVLGVVLDDATMHCSVRALPGVEGTAVILVAASSRSPTDDRFENGRHVAVEGIIPTVHELGVFVRTILAGLRFRAEQRAKAS